MFGLGKKKITAAHAVEAFIEVGTKDAVENFLQWVDEISDYLEHFGKDATPLRDAVRETEDSVLLFAGTLMAGGLMAPKNLFKPAVANAIYAEAARQLSASSREWFGPFVMGVLKQAQATPAMGFPSLALVKELRLAERAPELERFLLGPLFRPLLVEFECRVPVTSFWKRLSDQFNRVP